MNQKLPPENAKKMAPVRSHFFDAGHRLIFIFGSGGNSPRHFDGVFLQLSVPKHQQQ
jgi:hypothetical protein